MMDFDAEAAAVLTCRFAAPDWVSEPVRAFLNRPRRVIIEAPWRGDDTATALRNERYTLDAMADSLRRREAPLSSAVLYALSGLLDDENPRERSQGMTAGFWWGEAAELVAVYEDYGISEGMEQGIRKAKRNGVPVEYRRIVN